MGTLAILSIFLVEAYWITKSWKLNEKKFHQKVTTALTEVAKDLVTMTGSDVPAQDLIKRVEPNYYIVNVNNSFDADNLEFFLKKEFNEVALHEDFEYGIYNCETDKMVRQKYVSFSSNSSMDTVVTKELPVDDSFIYYFGVRFPDRDKFIFSGMAFPIILSLLLLLSVIFFAYSLSVILRQKRLSEMQKDFINNMTHEFKTPISTVNISSDVLLRTPEIQQNKRLLQYANIIKEQNMRLNNQVEKVLQFARIEKRDFALKKEDLNLNELLRSIAYSVQLRVDEQDGQFELELPSDTIWVRADKLHLTNILHNLLDNAIKYSKDRLDIRLAAKIQGKKVVISVSDKGIGIPKEYQHKVFRKFFRIPTGNVHNVKGFGLGLFYVKNICRKHGWQIRLDSKPGQGTTVVISIPIHRQEKVSEARSPAHQTDK